MCYVVGPLSLVSKFRETSSLEITTEKNIKGEKFNHFFGGEDRSFLEVICAITSS